MYLEMTLYCNATSDDYLKFNQTDMKSNSVGISITVGDEEKLVVIDIEELKLAVSKL